MLDAASSGLHHYQSGDLTSEAFPLRGVTDLKSLGVPVLDSYPASTLAPSFSTAGQETENVD